MQTEKGSLASLNSLEAIMQLAASVRLDRDITSLLLVLQA